MPGIEPKTIFGPSMYSVTELQPEEVFRRKDVTVSSPLLPAQPCFKLSGSVLGKGGGGGGTNPELNVHVGPNAHSSVFLVIS